MAEARLKAGDTELVLGAGGVSMFALQFAKAMGATVIVTSSSDEKLERVATSVPTTRSIRRLIRNWGKTVWDWIGGRGVDHVIELGGPETVPQSIVAVRIGGHISLIGTGRSGEVPILLQKLAIRGPTVSALKKRGYRWRPAEPTLSTNSLGVILMVVKKSSHLLLQTESSLRVAH